jgi:DNA polymerase III subunit delta
MASASQNPDKSRAAFFRQLKEGKVAPLYLFEGTEDYLREQALSELIRVTVDESVRAFNVAAVSVAEGEMVHALDLARQLPMISQHRVLVVTQFEQVSDEKALEQLKAYLRNPVETTALVFVSDLLDNRRNITTTLRKGCTVVAFEPLSQQEAVRWVIDYARRSGSLIDNTSAAYLVGKVGTQLRRLAGEIDKLATYASTGTSQSGITQIEIDELVRYSHEHTSFELTDAMLDGDRKRALALLDRIFSNQGESPSRIAPMILGAIASHHRRLFSAHELMLQNKSSEEVRRAVGLFGNRLNRFNEMARRTDRRRLLMALKRIAETDVALKTSLATPRLQLELLICELCRNKHQPAYDD